MEYCTAQHTILQIVVGYNHTMQCRAEAAIAHVKQHVRISLTTASAPTRWWPHATTDFAYKKNYLWHSLDTAGNFTTPHQRMSPAFAGTRHTVAIPFGSRIVSTIPREHKLVVNGSFGDRYVEGTMIYLHADPYGPSAAKFCYKTTPLFLIAHPIKY